MAASSFKQAKKTHQDVPLIKRSFLSEQKNVPIRSLCFGRTSFPFPFQCHRAIVSLAERNPHNSPGGRKTRQFVKARVAKLIGVFFLGFLLYPTQDLLFIRWQDFKCFLVLWCFVDVYCWQSDFSWAWINVVMTMFFPITDAFVFMEPLESSLINRLCTEWS